jgi:hypothetical protein
MAQREELGTMRKLTLGVVVGTIAMAGLFMASPAHADQVGCGLATGGYVTPCVDGDSSGGSAGVTSTGAPIGGGVVVSGNASGSGTVWAGGGTSNPPPLDGQIVLAGSPDGVSAQCSSGGAPPADCTP